jgi:hypothetical protein
VSQAEVTGVTLAAMVRRSARVRMSGAAAATDGVTGDAPRAADVTDRIDGGGPTAGAVADTGEPLDPADPTDRSDPSDPAQGGAPVGKGRPTPRRSEAEAARRRPLVGAARGSTRTRDRESRREAWQRTQEAYRTEDQRYLPLRDRGPIRRLVRDVVDCRRNAGEYFLPAALIVLFLGVLPFPIAQLVSAVAMYTILGVVLLDSFLVFRRAKAAVRERFGEKGSTERGVGTYALSRALQMRRMRRPVPQVKPGQKPR